MRLGPFACLASFLALSPAAAPAALSTTRQQLVVQEFVSSPEFHDYFGRAIAVGFFDGDNYPDLAVGAHGETFGGVDSSGVVSIYYGGPEGLGGFGTVDSIVQGAGTVPGEIGDYNFFGRAFAVGDFDDDGLDDLAIGSWTDAGGESQAGAVTVLYGAPNGLGDLGGNQEWTQATTGVPGSPEVQEFWGEPLATGDFDGDGYADLAIGAPRDDSAGDNTGSVTVLYGGAAGLSIAGVDFLTGSSTGCSAIQAEEEFGSALAAGDFDGDGESDLAIGVPYEGDFPAGQSASYAGIVHLVPGSPTGLLPGSATCLFPGAPIAGGAVPGALVAGSAFGQSLAAGNFDRDVLTGKIHDDLAIGRPGRVIDGVGAAGEVFVLRGSAAGITATGSFRFDSSDVPGAPSPAPSQRFGTDLHALRATGNASRDLLVQWKPGGDDSTGHGLVVIPGTSDGLVLARALPLASSQSHLLVAPGQSDDQFGIAAATGDFDRDGFTDLALAAPGKSLPGASQAGVVLILRGALFSDSFETDDLRFWSDSVP